MLAAGKLTSEFGKKLIKIEKTGQVTEIRSFFLFYY